MMQKRRLSQLGLGLVFAGTIFLGAFLLFQVQPLLGRFLLPWFGGTPEVWTTCMLFFQVFLLAGYLYAHGLARIKRMRVQAAVHTGLLAAALLFLPIIPSETFKPTDGSHPILRILLVCSMTVGLPYFLLAATSPLIQVWFARAFPKRNPYRLYALSNTGSLLALATFPFVFEPLMTRSGMAAMWSITFAVFAVLCAGAVLLSRRRSQTLHTDPQEPLPSEDAAKPPRMHVWLWLGLSGGAVVELLAVTNKITQDIAVIPFLWILPLSLYLLSFIICFDHSRWYKRWLWIPLFIFGMIGIMAARSYEEQLTNVRVMIGLYAFMLFTCCMVCHGELYRLRPRSTHLTGYYLTIAAGGALGGFFVAVIAPLIFNTYIELYLGLLAVALFLLLAEEQTDRAPLTDSKIEARRRKSPDDGDHGVSDPATDVARLLPPIHHGHRRRRRVLMILLFAAGVIGILFMGKRSTEHQRAIANSRNFFGVLTIWEEAWDDPAEHKLLMQHGTTYHGLQFTAPELKDLPTAYYAPNSGIGIVLENWPVQTGRRIGIIGLGVGTIAAYGKDADRIRFYEINPDVERLAREYFTYLENSDATVEVALGDGRLVMENEPPQAYDVLVLDAFSSDAVPLHLLTTEAMEIYLKHLADDGVLAFHISTMHLDLQSIVWKHAEHFGLASAWIEGFEDETPGALASDWILLARNDRFLGIDAIKKIKSKPYANLDKVPLWTDDHINLFKILKKNAFTVGP
jgi:hypothetical protein